MDVAVLMWGGITDDPMLEALRRRGIPAVIVEGQDPRRRRRRWASTTGVGIREVTEHLLSLGHTRIATVTLPFNRLRTEGLVDDGARGAPRVGDHPPTDGRRRPTRASPRSPSTRRRRPWWSTASRRGCALLAGADRPTAVACQSDLLASGVVLAARELGLRVPQDVSVSGFDGLDLPWLAPDVLTTVSQPLAEKGAAIGHAVEDLLAGEPPTSRELPVELRIGTTTGPAPA